MLLGCIVMNVLLISRPDEFIVNILPTLQCMWLVIYTTVFTAVQLLICYNCSVQCVVKLHTAAFTAALVVLELSMPVSWPLFVGTQAICSFVQKTMQSVGE